MSTVISEVPRLGKKMGRPKSGREDVSVKIPKAIALKAKSIAKDRGIPLAEYLEEKLLVVVDKDYAAMLRRIDETTEK